MPPRITYTDTVDPKFGLPWPDDFIYDPTDHKAPLKLDYTTEELRRMLDRKYKDNRHAEIKEKMGWCVEQPAAERDDPIVYGWTLPVWRRIFDLWPEYIMFVLFGGNRSSKSTFAARLCVFLAMAIPEAEIYCWHVNEDKSKTEQQRFIWENLPARYRTMRFKKGTNHAMVYKQQTGFTNQSCILPPQPGYERGSTIFFKNYRQYLNDKQMAEGCKGHFHWCDEEAPKELVETLLARGGPDYHSKLILTFTTLSGYTDIVSDLLRNVKVDERRHAIHVGKEIPYEQTPEDWDRCKILYCWSQDNPFVDMDELVQRYSTRPMSQRLARLYGIPTKMTGDVFPKFSREVHVIQEKHLPWNVEVDPGMRKPEQSFYMVLDPAGKKNWYMLWYAVTSTGTIYVYREWPDKGTYGEWAFPHMRGNIPIGKLGPAARGFGYGYEQYIATIKEGDDKHEIYERRIDPRAGAETKQGKDSTTTIINELDDRGMYFIPAPGLREEHGIQKITSMLNYDDEKPVGLGNEPMMYISENCGNLIDAMQEYSGEGGTKEAWKDPVDALRYAIESDPIFAGGGSLEVKGGGAY